MMRHANAPTQFFSQISNDILRHPRLSANAVRLLTWQLSLPPGARECLSRTAQRAGIGKAAFQSAKRQLQAEGYTHEWHLQDARGLWITEQLVSNVPLTPEEALAVRNAERCLVTSGPGPVNGASPQVGPTAGNPAVGAPTGRSAGRCPDKDQEVNTSHHPAPPAHVPEPEPELEPDPAPEPDPATEPAPEREPAPEPDGLGAPPPEQNADSQEAAAQPPATDPPDPRARVFIESLPCLDPRLEVPRGMVGELTGLALRWLEAGHQPADIQDAVLRGLPTDQPVRRPGGLVRYLLRDVAPLRPAPAAPPAWGTGTSPASAPPATPDDVWSAHISGARLSRMRECTGEHVQARLFLPLGDEELCPRCTAAADDDRRDDGQRFTVPSRSRSIMCRVDSIGLSSE
jgi:hypothetical protein